MKAGRSSSDYLRDMLDAIDSAGRFTAGMDFAAFAADEKTVFAVVRALEIVGEAAKNISREVRDKHPELPWRAMAGMRDHLTHAYFGVVIEVVWRTVQEDLPKVRPVLQRLLSELS